jgi:hypothetical protein
VIKLIRNDISYQKMSHWKTYDTDSNESSVSAALTIMTEKRPFRTDDYIANTDIDTVHNETVTEYFADMQRENPVMFKAIIDVLVVLGEDTKFLNKIDSIDVKSSFFNEFDQEIFNKHLLSGNLSDDLAEKLDLDKIYACYLDCTKSKDLITKFSYVPHIIFRRLAVAGMVEVYNPEKENCLLPIFLYRGKGLNGYYDTLHTLLMYAEVIPNPGRFKGCSQEILFILCKFYFNRCQMLELERSNKIVQDANADVIDV